MDYRMNIEKQKVGNQSAKPFSVTQELLFLGKTQKHGSFNSLLWNRHSYTVSSPTI